MKLFTLLFFLISTPTFSITNLEELKDSVQCLLENEFPKIKDIHLSYREINEDNYFLGTEVDRTTLFKMRKNRLYYFEYHPKFFSAQISRRAKIAILAHELGHYEDFHSRNSLQLMARYARYFTSKKYYARVERETDVRALQRGHGDGLKEYRVWLYANIPSQDLPAKLRNYLNPDEISLWQSQNPVPDHSACL